MAVGERVGVVAVAGGEAGGLDHGQLDAELGDLAGERLVQALQGPLGGVVGAAEWHRDDPGRRRQLDDVARALLAQVRQRGLDHPHRAEQVGFELVAQFPLGQLLDRADLGVAGVVHDDVEPAEVLFGLLHGREDGGPVGHVQFQREDGVAVGVGQFLEGGGAPGGGGDLVTARQGGLDEVAAEAAVRAGDEPDFLHGVLLVFRVTTHGRDSPLRM